MSEVTPVQEWKKDTKSVPLELPSGKTCLVRPVGIAAFLTAGIVPNSLMKIITKALGDTDAKAEDLNMAELMGDLAEDSQMLQDMFAMADNVTIFCVLEPKVQPIPPPNADGSEPERDENLLYVDEIELEDKFFILNFGVGGSRDLEAFRSAAAGGVGSVPPSTDVQLPPQSPLSD